MFRNRTTTNYSTAGEAIDGRTRHRAAVYVIMGTRKRLSCFVSCHQRFIENLCTVIAPIQYCVSCSTVNHSARGVYPPTTMALFPPFSRLPLFSHPSPHLSPTPPFQTIFGHFMRNFCAILYVFSVNFGSWQSGIMTRKNENNTRWAGQSPT